MRQWEHQLLINRSNLCTADFLHTIVQVSCRFVLDYFTCAHKSGRVRGPPPICCTHCPHPPSWDKPWVTSEECHSTLSCVLIWINGAICWDIRNTTVSCKTKDENTIFKFTKYTDMLKAYLSTQHSSFRSFMTRKTCTVA